MFGVLFFLSFLYYWELTHHSLSILVASSITPALTSQSTTEDKTINDANDDNDDSSSEGDDKTLLGDLGDSSSSGVVGSSNMSSSTNFHLNIPCNNFPSVVSSQSDIYLPRPHSLTHNQDDDEEDDFSEDSLVESERGETLSRSFKKRRKSEQLNDGDDTLVCVDSLVDDSKEKKEIVTREMTPMSLISDVDSLELSPSTFNRQMLEKKISDINAQIREIEQRQMMSELETLDQEILSVDMEQEVLSVSLSGTRSKWSVTDIEIACDALDNNDVINYSYENSRRESATSNDESSKTESVMSRSVESMMTGSSVEHKLTRSSTDIDIANPPKPQRATLPSPVPNLSKLKKPASRPSSLKPRPMVEHSGAVGVTSMWIPSDAKERSSTCPVKPKIQSKPPKHPNTTNKKSPRDTNMTTAGFSRKLQINSILPNKHSPTGPTTKTSSEGSHGMLPGYFSSRQLVLVRYFCQGSLFCVSLLFSVHILRHIFCLSIFWLLKLF